REDGGLERRRLGRVHAPGPLADLLRRRQRPARVYLTTRRAGPPPRPPLRSDRLGRRPPGPQIALPFHRRVPRPGAGALADARARPGVLPYLLPALSPAVRPPGPLDARAGTGTLAADGRSDRSARVDPGVVANPGRRRGGLGRLHRGHAPG